MRGLACVVALGACGRIGFGELSGSDATGDSSGGDGLVRANYVFVTAGTVVPNTLGGVAGADAFCQSAADARNLDGRYVAWAASPSSSMGSRLVGARGWIRLDGLPFADTLDDIKNGKIVYPVAYDSAHTLLPADTIVATGTLPDGTYNAAGYCDGWMPGAQTAAGAGWAGATTIEFTEITGAPCDQPAHFYCFGADRSLAASLPPPVAGRRAFVTGTTFTPSAAGLGAADTVCQNQADAIPLGGTFRALLATTTASAAGRFTETGTFVRMDGIPVAASATAFFDGAVDAAISTLPTGSYAGVAVASGAPLGAASMRVMGDATTTCGDWVDPAGNGTVAFSGGTGVLARAYSNASCAAQPLICLEQ